MSSFERSHRIFPFVWVSAICRGDVIFARDDYKVAQFIMRCSSKMITVILWHVAHTPRTRSLDWVVIMTDWYTHGVFQTLGVEGRRVSRRIKVYLQKSRSPHLVYFIRVDEDLRQHLRENPLIMVCSHDTCEWIYYSLENAFEPLLLLPLPQLPLLRLKVLIQV